MIGLVAAVIRHEEDEHQRAQQQEERIEQKRHDLERRHIEAELGAGGDGHEHLGAVGNHALEHAGEGIQDGCGLAPGDVVGLGHLVGDGVRHHDGHGVVGRGDVHGAHEQTHAQLAALAPLEHAFNAGEQGHETAVLANEGADGAYEHGHHGGLEHAGRSRAHVPQKIGGRHRALGHHDDGAGQDAQQQHDEHVDAQNAAHQHDEVRNELDEVVVVVHRARDVGSQGQRQDEHEGHDGRGQGDLEVLAELVLHLAALALAGGDGGVGDERQVIAEHGAAHDRAHAQRQAEARGSRHGHGNGSDERDGTHRGAHGDGHEAADHEQHGHGELRRNDGQHEVGHRLGRVAPHGAHEHAGGHEDEDHGDDGLIADATAHNHQLVIEGQLAVLEAGHQQRNKEDHHDGDVVEPHGDAHAVLEQNAEPQIQHEEHPDRQQRRHISLFHVELHLLRL